jgi:tetratricopeptide (TPR) repeat protein
MLALVLDAAGKDAEADVMYRRSLGRVVAWRGEGHPEARKVRASYARFLDRAGRHEQAVELRQAALDAAVSPAAGTGDGRLADACADLADALMRAGKDAAAGAMLKRAVEMRRRAFGGDDALARAWWRKSVLWSALGRASSWRSEALFAQSWFVAEELLVAHGPARLRPDEPTAVMPSHFRLDRLDRLGRPDTPSPVAEGALEGLRALDDPAPGLYRLALELPRREAGSPAAPTYLLFCDWEVSFYPLPNSRPDPYVWNAITGRPAAWRGTARTLALTGSAADNPAATGGHLADFGLVATATLPLPAGTYRLGVTSDDGVRVWVDDRLVVDAWETGPAANHEATLTLPDGAHRLRVEYVQRSGAYSLWLYVAPQPATTASGGR